MFIPIYPVGVVAEMALMVAALPDLKAQQRYSLALPNPYNWAFEYDKFIQVGCRQRARLSRSSFSRTLLVLVAFFCFSFQMLPIDVMKRHGLVPCRTACPSVRRTGGPGDVPLPLVAAILLAASCPIQEAPTGTVKYGVRQRLRQGMGVMSLPTSRCGLAAT